MAVFDLRNLAWDKFHSGLIDSLLFGRVKQVEMKTLIKFFPFLYPRNEFLSSKIYFNFRFSNENRIFFFHNQYRYQVSK